MKIIWKENPLRSIIELNEDEKQTLKYKITIEELKSVILRASRYIENNSIEDAKKVLQIIDGKERNSIHYFYGSEFDNHIQKNLDQYLEYLKQDHFGDCIRVPCPCSKCTVEDMVGFSTVSDLKNYQMSFINMAFNPTEENDWKDTRNIDEAIEYLKNYEPTNTKGYEDYIDIWKKQAKEAYEYLKLYKEKRFNV